VTGKTWTLAGTPSHAVLTGLRPQAIEGDDARALLERELGWQVPVAGLVDWVRGMRAPGTANIGFRPDGLPAAIIQNDTVAKVLFTVARNRMSKIAAVAKRPSGKTIIIG
jgi:outer membrane lipoprotein LolB